MLKRLLGGAFPKLADIRARAFQGLRTSDNHVYVLQGAGKPAKGTLRVASRATGEMHEIETALLKPMLSGEDIRAFSLTHRDQWILFPYDISREQAELLSERRLRGEYPGAWKYLKQCEKRLRGRERGRMNASDWWAYIYPKNLQQFEQPKVMLPGYNDTPAAALDKTGKYYHVSGYSITLRADSKLRLTELQVLLNSHLLFWIMKKLGVALQRGFVEFRPQYLDQLPIAVPSTADAKRFAEISEIGVTHGYERVAADLDEIVYKLYGLDREEILIVESSQTAKAAATCPR